MRLIGRLVSAIGKVGAAMAMFGLAGAISAVHADVPKPWQLGYQDSASPVMDHVNSFHDFLLVIIIAISLFVLALMVYVMIRFNAKRNPNPSKTTHNTTIEILWTVIPVVIVVMIVIPSFRLLYFQDRAVSPEMTLKVTGSQWYWTYEYPDQGGFAFDSLMVSSDEIKAGEHRLLEVDNRVVVPVDTDIRVLVTANLVIHSWAVPALGVKKDAIPGRLNETWFRADRPGVYYGQCSELCGINHGFMPIAVEAVSREDFDAWAAQARERFAATMPAPETPVRLARSETGAAR